METRRMCPNCRAFITTSDRVCPYCDAKVGPRSVDMRSAAGSVLGGLVPSAQFATVLILTINVGLYLVTAVASMKEGRGGLGGIDIVTLTLFGAARQDFLYAGQWWRLITAGFLHGGLMHILFNCWALMDVGTHAEEIYGTRRMTAIYLISSIGGFVASMLWRPTVSVGASAGLFGLIGAMIALGVRHKTMEASIIKGFYVRWAIYGLLWGLLPFFRVDNAAHIGGLAAGFVAALVAGLPRPMERWREGFWGVAAGLLVMLTVFAFLSMYLWMSAVTKPGAGS